ncbi:MAG: sugar transferase [Chlorobiaceae bacterium]|jgi:lipopolysaccharide/colanic/teichoic acid biosynthesis glycosyltransferase|nr:sugar transferase [Chlorobiaceae bacterium]NTV16690.1 sugar transferase [Chlorobiaceae bacterium]
MFKRFFDLVVSLIGLMVFAPFLLIIAVVLKIDSPGLVFFRQIRVGQFGTSFRIFKFRTMVSQAEKLGPQVSSGDDPRITRVGRFLRKYKLDELPQLINVVKGEMSFVGPRPEVPRYVEAYKNDYREILTVKPGITDFASLEFKDENELLKNADDPEKKYLDEILPVKIGYYRKYLKEQSLKTDLTLIIKTLWSIIR